jgi:AcrR family transcriptional regulator
MVHGVTEAERAEPAARRALLDAAKAMLPLRAPSTVTGRELADAAGVNYGLVHHYFGSKDAVLRDALLELRDEFLAAQDDLEFAELLHPPQPFLRAIGRSQNDYPDSIGSVDEFPAGDAMVDSVRTRLFGEADRAAVGDVRGDVAIEAKARVMAMMCLQLGRAMYADLLHDMVAAGDDVGRIEAALEVVYREVAGIEG